jgi:SAM-dependent methyltransferase
MNEYSAEFFREQRDGSRRSAQRIVPLVVDLVRPRSVVDLGCGVGTWLSVFRQLGVKDVLGIDGDYVDRAMLEIPPDCFQARDLTRPVRIDRQFDLAMSLEVGEHLPPESARGLVESLVGLAPVVLFSAAIPHQRGVNHLNEQWPQYWKAFFDDFGYVVIDCIRRQVWCDSHIQYWYAQNILLYVRKDRLEADQRLLKERAATRPGQLALVHPEHYLYVTEWEHPVELAIEEIARVVPLCDCLLLADAGKWGLDGQVSGRRLIPFTELNGHYNGAPENDAAAVDELEKSRAHGASFIAFAWPAFEWLEWYPDFHRHLCSRYRRVLENPRVIVFDLRGG